MKVCPDNDNDILNSWKDAPVYVVGQATSDAVKVQLEKMVIITIRLFFAEPTGLEQSGRAGWVSRSTFNLHY